MINIGQKFVWASPVDESTWDKFKIYRAPSLTGTYALIATIDAKDTNGRWVTYYWDIDGGTNSYYEVEPYETSSGKSGGVSDPIGGTTITVSYTTPAKVAGLMQVDDFGGSTRPTIWTVLDIISQKEDEIDYTTGHAWRTRYSLSASGADTASPNYKYFDLKLEQRIAAGIPVFLKQRSIKDFAAISGDALEVYDGNAYIDYLTSRTQGRANDWWLDNGSGTLYIKDITRTMRDKSIRVKFRYGETSVPGTVTRLCNLLVAIDLAMSNDRSYLIPTGGDGVRLDSKVTNWQKQADELMAKLTEWKMTGT